MDLRRMASANRSQHSKFPQGYLYHLTFNQLQTQLGNVGKPLSSTYLDELLKHVISAEKGQYFMQNPAASSSSSSSSPASFFLGNFNLNGVLDKKTVEEVWEEILHHQHLSGADNGPIQHLSTLGETTLEEFLVRAGVISLGNQNGSTANALPFMTMDPMAVVPHSQLVGFSFRWKLLSSSNQECWTQVSMFLSQFSRVQSLRLVTLRTKWLCQRQYRQ